MEQLKQDLMILMKVILHIERGDSVRQSLQAEGISDQKISITLRDLLVRGQSGEPILESLRELQLELIQQLEFEIDRQSALLPLKALIPLLLFQFPALLIMALGPLLASLYKFV